MGVRSREVTLLRNELQYNYAEKKELLREKKEELEDLIYLMGGVKGVRFDAVRGVSAIGTEEKNERFRKKKSVLEDKIETLKKEVEAVDKILKSIEKKDNEAYGYIQFIFIEKHTFSQAQKKFSVSSNSVISYRIDKAIEKALEEG